MTNSIPIIDLSPIFKNENSGILKVANLIKEAYQNYGFAYLINHNITPDQFKMIFATAKDFHNLPLEEKLKIKQNDCFRGYVPINASQLRVSTLGSARKPNQLDAFVMAFEPDTNSDDYKEGVYLNGDNQFPDSLTNFKENMLSYRNAMLNLTKQLLPAFSIALGMDKDHLSQFFSPPTYFLRLQHYPKQPDKIADDLYGIAPRTDYGFFTILAQNEIEGLEVLSNDNQWISVPHIKNSLVLNTGDMLKRMSNNSFKSTKHRVINKSNKDRFSVPFFFEPNMRSIINVLPSCIDNKHPKLYESILYGEYLMDRIQGNYNLGKREA